MENINKQLNLVKAVGRQEKPITFDASGEALIQGAIFNEEIHKTFRTNDNGVLKGLYHFKTHTEANEHMEDCIAKKMARKALGY